MQSAKIEAGAVSLISNLAYASVDRNSPRHAVNFIRRKRPGCRKEEIAAVIRLPRAVYDALRAHGEATYPLECCGVLLGRPCTDGWQIESSAPASNANIQSPRTRFEIAPTELVSIMRDARSRGLEIAGFYHSHPDSVAAWSATDLAEAHWVGCCYLITAVAGGRATETRAFLLAGTGEENKHFEPETFSISAPCIDSRTA